MKVLSVSLDYNQFGIAGILANIYPWIRRGVKYPMLLGIIYISQEL